jgi:type II secretory pathway pseudopilin PulG
MSFQTRLQKDVNLSGTLREAKGFSILQTLITFAIVSIVSTFAVINIHNSRHSLRLQNSVRQLAGYLEKARLDSIRRHANPVNSSVVFTSPTSYDVTMDFAGSGTPTTRTFAFENGVEVFSNGLPSVSFNWRGRTSACTNRFAVKNSRGEQSEIDVSDAGDVTIDRNVDVLSADVTYGSVNSNSGVQSSTIVPGGGLHNNIVDCAHDSAEDPPGPPITGGGPGCPNDSANPSSFTIKKNYGSSKTVAVTSTSTGTIVVTKPINFDVTPMSQTVTAGGTVNFTVSSNNNIKSGFAVVFSTPCGASLTVLVTVTN